MRVIQDVLRRTARGRPPRLLALGALAMLFFALGSGAVSPGAGDRSAEWDDGERILLLAARVFDGNELRNNAGVLVAGRDILAVGAPAELRGHADREIDLGDSTILPGFIELHAHVTVRRVPRDTVLRHGVTTVRDIGGPLLAPSGGDGHLRLLTAGPIITVPGGYPIPVFGKGYIAEAVRSAEEARLFVRKLVEGGAVVIKVALEPGGEPGAPWTAWTASQAGSTPPPWPMASVEIVSAIVAEAHRLGKLVAAHIAESQGVAIALAAGVDEWAHIPCSEIGEDLLRQAVRQGVKVVTTLDTLSHCSGIRANATRLAELGATFLYGAEIAHPEIPWGIDAQELHLMEQFTGMSALDLFRTATAEAGKELGMAPLGTLSPGAPADIIAVRGDPFKNFKLLEYPDLVISGGRIVVNEFETTPTRSGERR